MVAMRRAVAAMLFSKVVPVEVTLVAASTLRPRTLLALLPAVALMSGRVQQQAMGQVPLTCLLVMRDSLLETLKLVWVMATQAVAGMLWSTRVKQLTPSMQVETLLFVEALEVLVALLRYPLSMSL
jgi:hypothetical protein